MSPYWQFYYWGPLLFRNTISSEDILKLKSICHKKPENDWLFLNVYQDIGRVPKGHVWVIGDNRSLSWYGMVKIKNIKSLVIF